MDNQVYPWYQELMSEAPNGIYPAMFVYTIKKHTGR